MRLVDLGNSANGAGGGGRAVGRRHPAQALNPAVDRPLASHSCRGLLPMAYRMDRNPLWKVLANIVPASHGGTVIRALGRRGDLPEGKSPWIYSSVNRWEN